LTLKGFIIEKFQGAGFNIGIKETCKKCGVGAVWGIKDRNGEVRYLKDSADFDKGLDGSDITTCEKCREKNIYKPFWFAKKDSEIQEAKDRIANKMEEKEAKRDKVTKKDKEAFSL